MNPKLFINMLIVTSLSYQAFASDIKIHPKEVKDALQTNGYYASQNMYKLHKEETLNKINSIFETIQTKSTLYGQNAHIFGNQERLDIYIKKTDQKFEIQEISYEKSSIQYNENDLQVFLEEVFQPLSNGEYFVILSLVSDISKFVKEQEINLKESIDKKTASKTFGLLGWHTDRYPQFGEKFNFEYLYFIIPKLTGLTEHSLLIGKVEEQLLASGQFDKKDVTTICEIKSQSGAGYYIDQRKPIVHSHSGYTFIITNFKVTDNMLAEEQLNNPKLKAYTTDSARNINSETYTKPLRNKIAVNIKKL